MTAESNPHTQDIRRSGSLLERVAHRMVAKARGWDESKHPRAKDGPGGEKDGRFTSKGGGAKTRSLDGAFGRAAGNLDPWSHLDPRPKRVKRDGVTIDDYENIGKTLKGVNSAQEARAFFDEHFAGIDKTKYRIKRGSLDAPETGTARHSTRQVEIHAVISDKKDRTVVAWIDRKFLRRRGGLVVEHEHFEVEKSHQGTGFATAYLDGAMKQYRRLGVARVRMYANISVGGYSWAKYGFVPTLSDWRGLIKMWKGQDPDAAAQQVRDRDTKAAADRKKLSSPKHEKAMQALVNSLSRDKPEDIWRVADSVYGKALLLGTNYNAEMSLKPGRSLRRWNGYMRKKKRRAA